MKKIFIVGVAAAIGISATVTLAPVSADAGIWAKQTLCFTRLDYNRPVIKSRFINGDFQTYTWGYETIMTCMDFYI